MKKYKTVPATILLIAAIIMLMAGSIPKYISVILLAVSLALYVWSSRGSIYFAKGNKIMQKDGRENIEKSRPYYEKAYKAGVPPTYELYIAIIMVQYFDYEKGADILRELCRSKDKNVSFQAKNSLSMYYWIKKDYKEAIRCAEDAKDMGLKDRNLYINLGTYYLAAGDERKFRLALREACRNKLESIALLDLEAVQNILDDNYVRAGGFLKSLFDAKTPRFIDPYVHEAMVYMHYGEAEKAAESLRNGLSSCYFSNTSVLSEEQIKTMISLLEDPETRHAFIEDIEKNRTNLINGKLPEARKGKECPEYPELPEFIAESIKEKDIDEKDDGDIDTSLTEDDEKWLKKHST